MNKPKIVFDGLDINDPPSPEATYERARRIANIAVFSVELQCQRVRDWANVEGKFKFRFVADFHFLLIALMRVRKAARIAAKIPEIEKQISKGISEFDSLLPNIKLMRDISEHIDAYAVDRGKEKVSRKDLEVFILPGEDDIISWGQFDLSLETALQASINLFEVIRSNQPKPKT